MFPSPSVNDHSPLSASFPEPNHFWDHDVEGFFQQPQDSLQSTQSPQWHSFPDNTDDNQGGGLPRFSWPSSTDPAIDHAQLTLPLLPLRNTPTHNSTVTSLYNEELTLDIAGRTTTGSLRGPRGCNVVGLDVAHDPRRRYANIVPSSRGIQVSDAPVAPSVSTYPSFDPAMAEWIHNSSFHHIATPATVSPAIPCWSLMPTPSPTATSPFPSSEQSFIAAPSPVLTEPSQLSLPASTPTQAQTASILLDESYAQSGLTRLPCRWEGCTGTYINERTGRSFDTHFAAFHPLVRSRNDVCRWSGCQSQGRCLQRIKKHVQRHSPRRENCSFCGHVLSREDSLKRHQYSACRQYCGNCKTSFTSEEEKARHPCAKLRKQ